MNRIDDRDDEMSDYDFDNDVVLDFNPIFYNEPILKLEKEWNRKLSDHEKHVLIWGYRFGRTQCEVEEISFLEVFEK